MEFLIFLGSYDSFLVLSFVLFLIARYKCSQIKSLALNYMASQKDAEVD